MGHWRDRKKFEMTVGGATTRIVLNAESFGYSVRGWTHSLGNAKVLPEGNPFLSRMFEDLDEATEVWSEACNEAIDTPYLYDEPPRRLLSPKDQAAIDDASVGDGVPRPPRPLGTSADVVNA